MKKAILFLLITMLYVINLAWANPPFQPRAGDLLFQDLNCGSLCNAIGEVTYGIDNTQISHVGMVVKNDRDQLVVIEAMDDGVVETALSQFLSRSLDQHGKPRVIIGRLTKAYQKLIPAAILAAKEDLGKPYNASFIDNGGKSLYCSELIYDAFMEANHNRPIFHENPMDFRDRNTRQIVPAWKTYFDKLHISPPTGKLATNPGQLSREANIQIVHWYGQLRPIT